MSYGIKRLSHQKEEPLGLRPRNLLSMFEALKILMGCIFLGKSEKGFLNPKTDFAFFFWRNPKTDHESKVFPLLEDTSDQI